MLWSYCTNVYGIEHFIIIIVIGSIVIVDCLVKIHSTVLSYRRIVMVEFDLPVSHIDHLESVVSC